MTISEVVDFIAIIILAIGAFFNILAGLGLLRFPDVYTRLHAGTKCTTFGAIFICGSVILLSLKMWYLGNPDGSVLAIHTLGALIAILVTNPTGAHAIARAAHRSGVKPVGAVVDDLAGKPARKSTSKRKEADK
jgi:multicomponent Na+:H+ antiporter subunit G